MLTLEELLKDLRFVKAIAELAKKVDVKEYQYHSILLISLLYSLTSCGLAEANNFIDTAMKLNIQRDPDRGWIIVDQV
jgi:hypothetical protein